MSIENAVLSLTALCLILWAWNRVQKIKLAQAATKLKELESVYAELNIKLREMAYRKALKSEHPPVEVHLKQFSSENSHISKKLKNIIN